MVDGNYHGIFSIETELDRYIEHVVFASEALATFDLGAVTCTEGEHEFDLPCPHCGAAL